MSQHQRLSNEPTRYDQTRVARLKPIEKAIERLRLPPIRARKLGAVLSALEVQIEDGGDSPEANRFLLEAVRAGVRHQVDEGQARAVLRAIDALERAEDERWEQLRAGTLPPITPSPEEQLDELMQEGYDLQQANRLAAACDRWLEAWELVKRLARPTWRTTDAFDRTYGMTQSIFNWCQDLEMELGNAGVRQPIYHEHRLRYAREFLAQFPDEDALFQVNFTRAQGEALGDSAGTRRPRRSTRRWSRACQTRRGGILAGRTSTGSTRTRQRSTTGPSRSSSVPWRVRA